MENVNLHKQKLYALALAALSLIAIILPWQTFTLAFNLGGFGGFGGGGSGSVNGFRGWGWLSLIGVIAVVVASLMGDKTKTFDDTFKKVALAGFGAIALGAIIFMIRVMSVGGQGFKTSPGFGLFICLIAGVAGLAWVAGLIKLPENKPPASPTPPPPTV
jgi:hypothetical protein